MKGNFFINIGRQLGSGGHEIGKKLAEELHISFYDKELITLAAQESGLGKELFEKADEKTSYSLWSGLLGMRNSFEEIYMSSYLGNETLFNIQSEVIRNLSTQESSVFLGRCADYVLKDLPNCINIFISANIDDRIKRVAGIQQIPEDRARHFIEKMDKKREEYYNFYSNKIWGEAQSYHLCINSSVLGIERTASFIGQFVERKLEL